VSHVTLDMPLLVELAQLVLLVVLHVLTQQQISHTVQDLELIFGLEMLALKQLLNLTDPLVQQLVVPQLLQEQLQANAHKLTETIMVSALLLLLVAQHKSLFQQPLLAQQQHQQQVAYIKQQQQP